MFNLAEYSLKAYPQNQIMSWMMDFTVPWMFASVLTLIGSLKLLFCYEVQKRGSFAKLLVFRAKYVFWDGVESADEQKVNLGSRFIKYELYVFGFQEKAESCWIKENLNIKQIYAHGEIFSPQNMGANTKTLNAKRLCVICID